MSALFSVAFAAEKTSRTSLVRCALDGYGAALAAKVLADLAEQGAGFEPTSSPALILRFASSGVELDLYGQLEDQLALAADGENGQAEETPPTVKLEGTLVYQAHGTNYPLIAEQLESLKAFRVPTPPATFQRPTGPLYKSFEESKVGERSALIPAAPNQLKSPPRRRASSARSDRLRASRRDFDVSYTCTVAGYVFRMLHKLEGKFVGDRIEVRGQGTEPKTSSVRLDFDENARSWLETSQQSGSDFLSTLESCRLVPVSDGQCVIKPLRAGSRGGEDAAVAAIHEPPTVVTLREFPRENLVVITSVDVVTQRTTFVETVACAPDLSTRTRTVQRFDADGAVSELVVYNERRYIDEESGAIFAV